MFRVRVLYGTRLRTADDGRHWYGKPFMTQEVAHDQLVQLRTDGVLAISASEQFGDRTKLAFRMWGKYKDRYQDATTDLILFGSDFYAIIFDTTGGFYWDQWDEEDGFLFVKDIANPTGAIRRIKKDIPRFPASDTVHEFTGGYAEKPDWLEVMDTLETRMF